VTPEDLKEILGITHKELFRSASTSMNTTERMSCTVIPQYLSNWPKGFSTNKTHKL